jgi:hypothetical protein
MATTAVVATAVVATACATAMATPTAATAAGAATTRIPTAPVPARVAHPAAGTHPTGRGADTLRATGATHTGRHTLATAAPRHEALDIRSTTAAILGPAIGRRLLRDEQRARLDRTATAFRAG